MGYLDDHDWDTLGEDWLDRALAHTATPCKGARGPLTRIRARPGESAHHEVRLQLAFHLQPVRRAPVLVPRVTPLRDDAFPPFTARSLPWHGIDQL